MSPFIGTLIIGLLTIPGIILRSHYRVKNSSITRILDKKFNYRNFAGKIMIMVVNKC